MVCTWTGCQWPVSPGRWLVISTGVIFFFLCAFFPCHKCIKCIKKRLQAGVLLSTFVKSPTLDVQLIFIPFIIAVLLYFGLFSFIYIYIFNVFCMFFK